MAKIIDLDQYKSTHQTKEKTVEVVQIKGINKTDVIGFEEAKVLLLEKERRENQRTILTEFVSAYVVLPERGLLKVDLFNISDRGLAFDVDASQGKFDENEELALRIYLNHKTYFAFTLKVKYANLVHEEGVIRHGTEFSESSKNDSALQCFVNFIEAVSAKLKQDDGDLLVPNIS